LSIFLGTVEQAYADVQRADAAMPDWARQCWRWRILYLRTLLDAELKANGGKPTRCCLEAFRELNQLYFVTDQTERVVRAPLATRCGPGSMALNSTAAGDLT